MTEFEQDMGPYIPDIAPEDVPQDTAPWETPDQDTPFQVPDQDPNLLREDEILRPGHAHGDGLPADLFDMPEGHLGVGPHDTSDIPDIPGWHSGGDDQPDVDGGDNPYAIN